MNSKSPSLPPIPGKTGPGRKRPGPVPAWGLKLGGFLTTLSVFVSSFAYASTNLYVTNAPLQPARVAEVATTTASAATATPSTASTTTTTLTSTVRTTTRAAVTVTKKS